MLRYTLHERAQILIPFYNRILITGPFLEPLSKSILCSIFKVGSHTDPNEIRVISLNYVFNKILSHLFKWANENNKIDEAQAGFREKV